MLKKYKTAQLIKNSEKVMTVKFINGYEIFHNGVSVKGEREVVITNLDMKPLLKYQDKWEKSFHDSHHVSNIYCYDNFFVREIDDFNAKRENKRKQGYLVYDYNGKMIGGGKGSWIQREGELVELYGDY